jgi:hypothetical protein
MIRYKCRRGINTKNWRFPNCRLFHVGRRRKPKNLNTPAGLVLMSRARAKEARAPTQQQMTHNMMTRSKTRAAACKFCGETNNEQMAGCCNDGDCPHNIENMCMACGTWDNEDEVWLCPDCDNWEGDPAMRNVCYNCHAAAPRRCAGGCDDYICDYHLCYGDDGNLCKGCWRNLPDSDDDSNDDSDDDSNNDSDDDSEDLDSEAEAADLDFRLVQARWNDLDNYTMMGMTVPNSEAWADLRLERQALNCYLKTTGKPWPKIRDTAACIAWCRAP